MLDLDPAAQEVARLLDGVTDDRLAAPTPCGGTSVATLFPHFMGLCLAFTWAARKSMEAQGGGQGPGSQSAENLDPDWRTRLPERLIELADAWRDPMAWEGMTEAGGVSMPAEQMGVVALDELVLHGWDPANGACGPLVTKW